jgi:membrane protein YqaA with SNARE-associated domain
MQTQNETIYANHTKSLGFFARALRDPYLWFLVGWVTLIILLGVFVFAKPWNYFCVFVALVSIASTTLPIPTNPIVLTVAKFFPPLLVALVATLGMVLANLMDYQIFSKLTRTGGIKRLRKTRIYKSWVKLFVKIPFLAISISAFIPMPVDFIRLLAILEGYPRLKFSIASFVGRLPRNLLLVMAGIVLPLWSVLLVALALVIPSMIYSALDARRERLKEEARARGEQVGLDEGHQAAEEVLSGATENKVIDNECG